VWEEGPTLPEGGGLPGSCAVAISNITFLLIGAAYASGTNSTVHEFSFLTGAWTQWPVGLSVPRFGHACSSFQGKVVVAGGFGAGGLTGSGLWDGYLSSTDILDPVSQQIRTGGPMATPRAAFGMYKIGYAGRRILMTYGSASSLLSQLYAIPAQPFYTHEQAVQEAVQAFIEKETLLQEWDPATEVWKPAPAVMAGRAQFSAVTVEARHVCPQGELLACSKV
jgi:hypothetical protein